MPRRSPPDLGALATEACSALQGVAAAQIGEGQRVPDLVRRAPNRRRIHIEPSPNPHWILIQSLPAKSPPSHCQAGINGGSLE